MKKYGYYFTSQYGWLISLGKNGSVIKESFLYALEEGIDAVKAYVKAYADNHNKTLVEAIEDGLCTSFGTNVPARDLEYTMYQWDTWYEDPAIAAEAESLRDSVLAWIKEVKSSAA